MEVNQSQTDGKSVTVYATFRTCIVEGLFERELTGIYSTKAKAEAAIERDRSACHEQFIQMHHPTWDLEPFRVDEE
jgi:signal transduction protein with GAF and PtsI domain